MQDMKEIFEEEEAKNIRTLYSQTVCEAFGPQLAQQLHMTVIDETRTLNDARLFYMVDLDDEADFHTWQITSSLVSEIAKDIIDNKELVYVPRDRRLPTPPTASSFPKFMKVTPTT